MNFETVLVWGISLLSIFMSVFWISVFARVRGDNGKKITRFPTVSVIIPAYNEEENIKECVQSVLNLDYPKDKLDVIVVNDGSTDRTEKIAKDFGDKITLIKHEKNRGRKAIAVNTGIKHSKSEFVVCMDADSIVSPDCLKKMLPHFENEKVMSVTAAMKVKTPRTLVQRLQGIEYVMSIFLRRMMAEIDTISATPGPFSIYRAKVFDEIGLFDENNLTEDNEIAMRIQYYRYKIKNSADAFVDTVGPDTLRGLYKQRLRWYRGFYRNVKKYREMMINPRYGTFGMFQLPMTALSVVILFTVGYLTTSSAIRFIIQHANRIQLAGFGYLIPDFANFNIFTSMLSLNAMMIFPLLATFIIGMYVLKESYHMVGERVRDNLITLVPFILFYYTALGFFWISAVTKEMFKGDDGW